MLRSLVVMLVLANASYLAWTKGWLASYGLAPASQSEPQRLAQQLQPEALRILSPLEARQLDPSGASEVGAESSPGPSARVQPAAECLQAGLFNEEQTAALRNRLQSALPAGSWLLESSNQPAQWMVYMGKYSGLDALAKKRNELRQLGVAFEPVNNPLLEPGLSLGSYSSRNEADSALARIAKNGVRTAKVIPSQQELRGQKLKLPAVDANLRAQLDAIKPSLAGKTLQKCK